MRGLDCDALADEHLQPARSTVERVSLGHGLGYASAAVITRLLPILAVAVAAATACGAASSGAAGASGATGVVMLSPASPVCGAGTSCTKPAKRFRLAFSRNGRTVVVTTDSRGRYRVKLERGRYAVRATNGRGVGPKQGLQPATVTVPRGRFAKRNFTYDSGIR
jgi:hypothetical protein